MESYLSLSTTHTYFSKLDKKYQRAIETFRALSSYVNQSQKINKRKNSVYKY